ncbi:hypothetical protein Leryth_015871 [Lithospermum erythrorhizon]|uniref:Bet v I/Major latex protein domain-containing protein n=1 Tax=Lithospermum erythrorhizon TaxID=34254 RepID=A0AAV3PZY4_LITER|nr:hypothetical protein Leryth_015871 [Lithospermum erythrorhizon]
MDGRVQEGKTVTEAVDDERKSITFTFVEGDIMQRYKKFKVTLSFSNMCGDNNYANWTIDFEKLSENVPEPNDLLNFIIDGCNDIELQGILQLIGISQPN